MPHAFSKVTARFGIYQPLVSLCTFLGIILSITSLFWLWSWSPQDNPEGFRSMISLRGQTTSAIAISSALLRTCIAVQLATCCMMMATLAFERKCVLLRDAAAMSMYRYSAGTPYSMLFPVYRGTRVGKNVFGIVLIA